MPSMAEAAKIRDVAARHAYVFDNGLCSPDFYDVEKRLESEEFGLLKERIGRTDDVLEIGSFTGLNLIGLRRCDHAGRLVGVEFVEGACEWMQGHSHGYNILAICGTFPECMIWTESYDSIVCFDVIEHQLNVGNFLQAANRLLNPSGRFLVLVPAEREYFDCGHVAFFPDAECLKNVLSYFFEIEECFELKTCRKLFASCRRRNESDLC